MKFPTVNKLAEQVAEEALDKYLYKGKTLREWIDIILSQEESSETKKPDI